MLKIRKIKVETVPVYDIAVQNVSNFFANDILVHNSEITLATDNDRTAVCCLSSLNVFYYDEFKSKLNLFVSDVAEMLDNVLTHFIKNAPNSISRARYSAMMERAIGIGVLGFHSYLQSKGIPFESVAAKSFNNILFKNIRKYADEVNLRLGSERGEAPDMVGSGKRFSHTLAPAPNACLQKETKILLSDDTPISFEDLINQFGEVPIDTLENIVIALEDGSEKILKYTDLLLVKRNGKTKTIQAVNIKENDEFVELV